MGNMTKSLMQTSYRNANDRVSPHKLSLNNELRNLPSDLTSTKAARDLHGVQGMSNVVAVVQAYDFHNLAFCVEILRSGARFLLLNTFPIIPFVPSPLLCDGRPYLIPLLSITTPLALLQDLGVTD